MVSKTMEKRKNECKIELFGDKRMGYCRRRPNERFDKRCVKLTVKHGDGCIMIVGGINWMGNTRLRRIEGIMDAKMYHGILVQAFHQGKNCGIAKNSSFRRIMTQITRLRSIVTIYQGKKKMAIFVEVSLHNRR